MTTRQILYLDRKLQVGLISMVLVCISLSTGHAYYDRAAYHDGPSPRLGAVQFYGMYHNVNKLLLHVSNTGDFGDWDSDPRAPSGEWPAGSGVEYLWAAGLWVGGIIYDDVGRADTLVSTAVYQQDYLPKADPRDIIYRSAEGNQGGGRLMDDDADQLLDEDPLDGYDSDNDGLVDEDFSAISQQMFSAVFYDTATYMNAIRTEDLHVPLGLMVRQESYAWTSPNVEDFIGIEYKVTNMRYSSIYKAYVGFMVDSDIGPIRRVRASPDDDMSAFVDTTVSRQELDPAGNQIEREYHLTIGYMFDHPLGEDGEVGGYIGVMFLGHTTDPEGKLAPKEVAIHVFRTWPRGTLDPRSDKERYRYLKGRSDTEPTIDPATRRAADYRFLTSAGPFAEIPPGSTLVFQCAFVCGDPFDDFIENAVNAQRVYNGALIENRMVNWVGSSPPPPPKQCLIAGDGKIIIEWDDYSERTPDPLLQIFDFAGYRIWKAIGWRHESEVPSVDQWQLIAHFGKQDLSRIDTGLLGIGKYRYVDEDVHNGLPYWYAVTAFDDGSAERVFNTATSRMDSIPRYGSYTQAMTLVYPRPAPARVSGEVRIVPNPYPGMGPEPRATGRAIGDLAEYERDPSGRRVRFINLPRKAMVRIYSLAGDLVWNSYFEDPTDPAGESPGWNLVSRNRQEIVSGIYLVHVESPEGEQITKLIIVR
jgi:hypothetical protein